MPTTIALVGNPNSGKTTLFNQLTGSHQYVGNWPGVTVEKKEGTLKGDHSVRIVDLPGIYSLSPYTNEEVISRDFLAGGSVDAILNIVDATNLERNLFLTEQLMEFGRKHLQDKFFLEGDQRKSLRKQRRFLTGLRRIHI